MYWKVVEKTSAKFANDHFYAIKCETNSRFTRQDDTVHNTTMIVNYKTVFLCYVDRWTYLTIIRRRNQKYIRSHRRVWRYVTKNTPYLYYTGLYMYIANALWTPILGTNLRFSKSLTFSSSSSSRPEKRTLQRNQCFVTYIFRQLAFRNVFKTLLKARRLTYTTIFLLIFFIFFSKYPACRDMRGRWFIKQQYRTTLSL
jgi:hypothetical protein